jgi:flavin reductase (DIM6/NTAB) family NADH-FMN oxidoreductase RutF
VPLVGRRNLPLAQVYRLLEPGPVVLLTTARGERRNVMTLSWHTMMEFEPPRVGCVVSENNFSFGLLRAARECALNVPGAEMAGQIVACGNTSGRDLDKFAVFGIDTTPASAVAAPLLRGCIANLECRVADARLVRLYNFFVLEVVKAWIDPRRKDAPTLHHRGMGRFMVAGRTIRLPSRMK